jgi:hypothetical protein
MEEELSKVYEPKEMNSLPIVFGQKAAIFIPNRPQKAAKTAHHTQS